TLAVLQFGVLPHEYELQLNVYAEGAAKIVERGPEPAEGGARAYKEHALPAFEIGQWKRVSIRVTTNSSFEVSLDGKVVLPMTTMHTTLPKVAPAFYLGVTYVDPPAAPWTVRYDDVAVAL